MSIRLLENKVVVVTGGSRGIGRAIAIESARNGADVLINYQASSDALYGGDRASAEVLGEITALGQRGRAIEGDIGNPNIAQRIVDAAVEHFGRIDVLASNAGICPFHNF